MVLNELADKHMGAMAFVLGAGPSLHYQDVSPLEDYVTITVNSSFLRMPECDYFVSDDQGIRSWNYYYLLQNSKCKKLLFEDKLTDAAHHFEKNDVVFFKHKTWYDPHQEKIFPAGIVMTKDPALPIVGARTSVGTAIHLAYIMGCSPIVMLGCDACFDGHRRYFWEFPGEQKAYQLDKPADATNPTQKKISLKKRLARSTKERARSFTKSLMTQVSKITDDRIQSHSWRKTVTKAMGLSMLKGKGVDHHCIDFNAYWDAFAKANTDKVQIINASGGILEHFPRLSLEDVLEQFGDRTKGTT